MTWWRFVHFLFAAALEQFHAGLGVWTYAIHEGTQYMGPGRKSWTFHLLDFLPALLACALIGWIR